MINKLIIIKNNKKGFSGVDIVIAMALIVIFVPLITTLFVNIYMNWMTTKRNAMANAYATQIIEHVEAVYYDELTENEVETFKNNLNIPSGYNVETSIETYTKTGEQTENLIKTITVSITYKVGQNTENVTMKSLKTKEILITPNIPKLKEEMIPVKYIGNEEITTSKNDSQWYSYENKCWAHAIKDDDIYVWIPRFAYNKNNAIEIKFLYSNTNRCVENNISQVINDGYDVPKAFKAENKEITGFWVIKSNTGYVCDNDDEVQAVNTLLSSKYGPKE